MANTPYKFRKNPDEVEERFPLIHTMPIPIWNELCKILDEADTWESIVGHMTDIPYSDVEGCRKYGQTPGKSSSGFLLRIWASKGYSYLHLYQLFAVTRMVRCLAAMKSLIPEKYHYLEEYALKAGYEQPGTSKASSLEPKSTQGHGSISRSTQRRTDRAEGSGVTPVLSSSSGKPYVSTSAESSYSSVGGSDPFLTALQNTIPVPYADLLIATDNFAQTHVVGKGGYGTVYRGKWKNFEVAVKRINANAANKGAEKERLRQSLQELRTLAKYRHDNILPLYGISLEGPEPCLVYQFMANGTLEERLQCRTKTPPIPPLTWSQKRSIILGSAKGLHFLHDINRIPIIHGDIKTANILLDVHMVPKLGDFGLSRDGQVEANVEDKKPLIASHIKGTFAYLPPEFITNKIFSTKLDVYSFGIVILEVATGLRAYSENRDPRSLLDWILTQESQLMKKGGNVKLAITETLADKRTPRSEAAALDDKTFWILLRTGLVCSCKEFKERPGLQKVIDTVSELSLDLLVSAESSTAGENDS